MEATAPTPDIAVVIATCNRETRLAFALDALASQMLPRERFEVVVVRPARSRGPLAAPPAALRVRFLVHEGEPGPAAQRNVGWRTSQAPLIAFMDDDSRPAPEWLGEMLAAADGDNALLQGPIEPDPAERHLLFGLARSHELCGASPRYETGNIVYPRALLDRLGGFDESFSGAHAWGEDTDLGVRARALGARAVYVDTALVWHAVLPRRLPAALRESRRYSSLVAALARHPEHRRLLFPLGVIKWSHVTVLLALGGATQARRRPTLAMVAASPYLAGHLKGHLRANPPAPRNLVRFALQLPLLALIEVAEVVATLRAAIRHRAPVI